MAWLYLLVAGLLEVVWAYAMKQSQGFTRLIPSIITLIAMGAAFGCWLSPCERFRLVAPTPSGPGSVPLERFSSASFCCPSR